MNYLCFTRENLTWWLDEGLYPLARMHLLERKCCIKLPWVNSKQLSKNVHIYNFFNLAFNFVELIAFSHKKAVNFCSHMRTYAHISLLPAHTC